MNSAAEIRQRTVAAWGALVPRPGPVRLTGRVVAVRAHWAYIEGFGPLVTAVVNPAVGPAPYHVVLHGSEDLGIAPGAVAQLDARGLHVGRLSVPVAGTVPVYEGWPAADVLERAVAAAGAGMIPEPEAGVATRWANEIFQSAGDGARLKTAGRGLIGRGEGLTPAGDDWLAGCLGVLAAAERIGMVCTARKVMAEAVRQGWDYTGRVSQALLAGALEGRLPGAALDCLDGWAGGRSEAALTLTRIGQSSGRLMAHGLWAGLRLLAGREG
jgi:hypothetical protein